MSIEVWTSLPTPEWAATLVSLALATISAGAALHAAVAVPWAAKLESAVAATNDRNGKLHNPATSEGVRSLARLGEVRERDPGKGLGRVILAVVTLMTALGSVGGLQIEGVGWLYSIVPVWVAAGVAVAAVRLPGRRVRGEADRRLTEMRS